MSNEKSAEPPILHSELMAFALACCPRLHDYHWWELAEALASSITTTTEICAAMASSIAEIKALWLAHLIVLEILQRRRAERRLRQALERTRVETRHMKELLALRQAMDAFKKAFYLRANTTP